MQPKYPYSRHELSVTIALKLVAVMSKWSVLNGASKTGASTVLGNAGFDVIGGADFDVDGDEINVDGAGLEVDGVDFNADAADFDVDVADVGEFVPESNGVEVAVIDGCICFGV